MGDQGEDEEQLRQLAAAVDDVCRPVARRPRTLSELRDTLEATGAHLTPAEIIAQLRPRVARSGERPGETPGGLPGASGAAEA